MKFDHLMEKVGELPFFDLALVVQLSSEPKNHLLVQLHRWIKAGKVLALRRGLYALADRYRRALLSPLMLANELYKPSYLSHIWALSFYGLIPEKVSLFSSATPRVTRSFHTHFGLFPYAKIKQEFFWGFSSKEIQGCEVWIADPEKALLDFWHLNRGEWTADRMREMRFQHFDMVDLGKLHKGAGRWASPRLCRAVSSYQELAETDREGVVVL